LYPRTPTLLFTLLLVCPILSIAQPFEIHRLLVKLQSAQPDTDRVNTCYAISRYYWNKDPDSALLMGAQALTTAEKAHYEKGMALAFLTEGVAYGTKGQYPEALAVLQGIPQEVNPALIGYQTAWVLFNLGRREEAAKRIDINGAKNVVEVGAVDTIRVNSSGNTINYKKTLSGKRSDIVAIGDNNSIIQSR